MKANELMIGDWVICHHPTCEPKQTQVTVGLLIGLERQDLGFQTEESPLFRIVEPIPLTVEILERNGFDCSDEEVVRYNFIDGDYKGHFSLRRMYNGNTPNGWSFFAFNVLTIIDYVHELQHALRLCGIEKEIEL